MWRGLTDAALAVSLAPGACNKGQTEADKKDDKDSCPCITISADESKSLGLAIAPAQAAASYRAQLSGFGVTQWLEYEA
jgi:hypothetical protein